MIKEVIDFLTVKSVSPDEINLFLKVVDTSSISQRVKGNYNCSETPG